LLAVGSSDLDRIDFQIISELTRNGRASYASLGKHVGLSPHGTADRVRRLQRLGVITGFAATVSLERVGRALDAFIDVRLLPKTTPERFESEVRALPSVREISFVTGRFDYLVRVACRNADELDETVRIIRSKAGAALTETRIVLRTARATPLSD
jgi:Lrp/AsnC family leucine-responsive transcriptional regulator